MNILQIFPGKVWGGAEQYVLDLGSAFQKRGQTISYVARNSNALTTRLSTQTPFSTIPKNDILGISTILHLRKILKETQPDLIHIHDTKFVMPTVVARWLCKSPAKIILTRHIARASRTNILYRPFFRKLHRIIFVSDLACSLWQSANKWINKNFCTVVHNSIPDTTPIKTNINLRDKYSIPTDVPIIIFSGRIRKSKGCATLIEALGKLNHLKFALVFVGKCKPLNYDKQLLTLAEEYGIADRIYFHGFCDNARSIMAQADIGVVPSIVREACPLTPMEFMQQGICVITTNNGGQVEYITHESTGLIVAPNNSTQLSNVLELALTNDVLRQNIGQQSQLHFNENLNYDKFVDAITAVYSS